jgi:hypothetical protein
MLLVCPLSCSWVRLRQRPTGHPGRPPKHVAPSRRGYTQGYGGGGTAPVCRVDWGSNQPGVSGTDVLDHSGVNRMRQHPSHMFVHVYIYICSMSICPQLIERVNRHLRIYRPVFRAVSIQRCSECTWARNVSGIRPGIPASRNSHQTSRAIAYL